MKGLIVRVVEVLQKSVRFKKRPIQQKSDAFLLQRHTLEPSDYYKIGPFLHDPGDPIIVGTA
jgi:hypothetical protein